MSKEFKISVTLLALTALVLSAVFVELEGERTRRERLAKLRTEFRMNLPTRQRPLQMDPEVIERHGPVRVAEIR